MPQLRRRVVRRRERVPMQAQLTEAMAKFQYLEFALRSAVCKFECLIRDTVAEFVAYPVNEKQLEKRTLGSLGTTYATYTADAEFKRRFKDVLRTRNRLAHALFVKVDLELFDSDVEARSQLEDVLATSQQPSLLGDEVHERMQHFHYDSESGPGHCALPRGLGGIGRPECRRTHVPPNRRLQ